jgi:hypothetical protein
LSDTVWFDWKELKWKNFLRKMQVLLPLLELM